MKASVLVHLGTGRASGNGSRLYTKTEARGTLVLNSIWIFLDMPEANRDPRFSVHSKAQLYDAM